MRVALDESGINLDTAFVMLSTTLIKEFQTILKEDYGHELSDEDAIQASQFVVRVFDELADMNSTAR